MKKIKALTLLVLLGCGARSDEEMQAEAMAWEANFIIKQKKFYVHYYFFYGLDSLKNERSLQFDYMRSLFDDALVGDRIVKAKNDSLFYLFRDKDSITLVSKYKWPLRSASNFMGVDTIGAQEKSSYLKNIGN